MAADNEKESTSPYYTREADFTDERVLDLLNRHLQFCHSDENRTANGKIYVLDLEALQTPDIKLWTIWDASLQRVLGCVALKVLRTSPPAGELKSMHVVSEARGSDVAAALLDYAVAEAKERGWERLYLETGTAAAFEPARKFYGKCGFVSCGPFGDYVDGENNTFMVREL